MTSSRFPSVVDEVTVRLIATMVLAVAVTALAAQQWWLYVVLAVDFLLRATIGPRSSPVAVLATRWLRPRVPVAPRPTPGAPKRFAAGIGAVLTVGATALWAISAVTGSSALMVAVVVIGVVMVVFPALEALFGVCVGCRVFAVLMRWGVVPEAVCLECSDITRRHRLRVVS